MVRFNSPLNLIAGIILAMPPRYGNLAHNVVDTLLRSGAPSFAKFAAIFKVTIIIFGYYLILLSVLHFNIPEHKFRKYSKI